MPTQLRFAVSRTVRAPVEAIAGTRGFWDGAPLEQAGQSLRARDTEAVQVGTVRTCMRPKALMGRTEVREELTEYAPGTALAYALDGPAGPFSSAASRWSTNPVSDHSTVLTVEGFFTPRNRMAQILIWPLAKPVLRRLTQRVIGELEVFVVRSRQPQA